MPCALFFWHASHPRPRVPLSVPPAVIQATAPPTATCGAFCHSSLCPTPASPLSPHFPSSSPRPPLCPLPSGYGTNYSQLWRFLPYIVVPTPCARPSPHPFPSPCLSLILMPFTGYGIDCSKIWRFLPYIAVPAHCTLLPCPTSRHQAQRSPLYNPCLQAMATTAARCGAFCHTWLCRHPVPCLAGMLPKTSCSALCTPLLASRLWYRLQRDVALPAIHRRAHTRGCVARSSRGGGAAAPSARAARASGHPKCGRFRAGVRVGR